MIPYLNYISRKRFFSINQDKRYSDSKAHIGKKINNILEIKKKSPIKFAEKKNFKKIFFL